MPSKSPSSPSREQRRSKAADQICSAINNAAADNALSVSEVVEILASTTSAWATLARRCEDDDYAKKEAINGALSGVRAGLEPSPKPLSNPGPGGRGRPKPE